MYILGLSGQPLECLTATKDLSSARLRTIFEKSVKVLASLRDARQRICHLALRGPAAASGHQGGAESHGTSSQDGKDHR